MGLELLTVVNATLCAILGPGLALRGPDGSMHDAVTGMILHYRFTLACFTMGIIFFMFSALLYAWMQFTWELALPETLVIFYFLYKIYGYIWRIYQRFKLPELVSGAFNYDDFHQTEEQKAAEQEQAQQAAAEAELHAKYAHLPEAVRASMGVGPAAGAPGPSGAS